jgi:hypothetical protein
MLETALINTLGVATWYIIGIAYVSTASRYWPHNEQMRGKWLPWDVAEEFTKSSKSASFDAIPPKLHGFIFILGFFMFLTIWPAAVYNHAKRGFRTKPGNHGK